MVRDLVGQIVLLLTEDSARRVLRYVGHQSVQLRERLIARVTVIVVLALQLAEGPAAALLGPVQGVRRDRAGGWENWGLCNGNEQGFSFGLNGLNQ